MIKSIFCTQIVFFIFYSSFAQAPLQKRWDHRYGGTGNEALSDFLETADGGFIAGGWSFSEAGGDKSESSRGGSDFWIVKTNSDGLKMWDKRFGGSLDDELHSFQQTSDGGYILGGFSRSGISGDKTQSNWDTSTTANPTADYWIIKIDSSGNKEWDKRFGGLYEDELYSVSQTSDGGYILGGFSYSIAGGDRTQPTWGSADYWIVKTDAQGIKEWDKRFGGSNNDQLYCIQQTNDNGYIAGGYTWSQVTGDKSQPNCGTLNNCDFWIIKIDSAGIKQWDKRYGGSENDEVYSLKQTNDNGYILAGYSWSGITGDKTEANYGPAFTCDYWIVKVDPSGLKQWDKSFGGISREDEFGNIVQTKDNGYLLAGSSYSDASGNKSESNHGIEQTWAVKTDSLGSLQWDKTIFTSGHDESGFALQASDGNYAFANYSNGNIGGYKTQLNRDTFNLSNDFFICEFSDTAAKPIAEFIASDDSICVNQCISFFNHSISGISYQWIFSGASQPVSTDENPLSVCYPNPGRYDVVLIASNNNGHDTIIQRYAISVFANPRAFSITQQMDTLFAVAGYTGYQWYHYSTPIMNAVDYFYVPFHAGNYNVLVTDSIGCKVGAGISIVDVGIDEITGPVLEIFTNSMTQELNITVNPVQESFRLTIVNLLGQEMYSKTFAGGLKYPFSLSHSFSSGIYIAEVKGSTVFSTQRFIVR